MGSGSRAHQLYDPSEKAEKTFVEVYKHWSRFWAIKSSYAEAKKVLDSSTKSTVYFSDLVNKLASALGGKW